MFHLKSISSLCLGYFLLLLCGIKSTSVISQDTTLLVNGELPSYTTSLQPVTIKDSITVAIAPQYDSVNGIHKVLLGKHYRKLWATPVSLPIFRLEEYNGGLVIIKSGGGQQTKSLRLEDKNDKQWVIRSVQKNPEKALPVNLRATIAKTIVQDQIAASNPFGVLTIPDLAAASGVPHTTPQLVYIPDDSALGTYRNDFANTVCLLEEREPGTEKTYSTQKVLEKLEADTKNSVNQKAVLRARMLDLLIGDWDRHEDQWRWIKRTEDDKVVYSPVPRDRDQAYFLNTGILPYIAARDWLMPKFQGFDNNIPNVNGFMYNARFFDRMFLNDLDEAEWTSVISELQASLSDDIIKSAIAKLPDTIYQQSGKQIEDKLINRRNHLLTDGLNYYRFLSRSIDIVASDKNEQFNIVTKENEHVVVTVLNRTKDEKPSDTLYNRTIDGRITKEIRLYGRGGADVFTITGEEKLKIKVRIIGGDGMDSAYVTDNISTRKNLMVYDRGDKKNHYPSKAVSLHTADNNSVNHYDAHSFKYNKLMPLISAGYNLDDGILFGIGTQYTKQGFRKEPFASRHRVMLGRSLKTNALFFNYRGEFTDLIDSTDFDITINVKAPNNTSNFFGAGNETTFDKTTNPSIKYYRTRYNFIESQLKLKWSYSKKTTFFSGLAMQYYNMDASDNEGRFIKKYENQTGDKNLYQHKFFAGIVAGFETDTRNNALNATRGYHWNTSVTALNQVGKEKLLGFVQSNLSFYISPDKHRSLVIANRFGTGISMGSPDFFQLFYLGGEGSLLGFRKNRFAGNAFVYHNIELRWKLFDFASYLCPGQVGLITFNDIGRVWAKEEASGKWHIGTGGGIYVVPAELLIVSCVAGVSQEGILPYINLGFRF